jgi:hypothetical protein
VNVFTHHLLARVLALLVLAGVVARRIKKGGGVVAPWASATPGALLGGVGLLFFLPFVHALPHLGQSRWIAELLMRPFGEWDVVLDAGFHRWLPLANALPVLVATALLFGVKSLRGALGGFALGSAALLAAMAVQGDVATPFGWLLTKLWLAANVMACMWIARLTLDRKKA